MRNALIGILLAGTMMAPATAQVAESGAESPRVQRKMEHYQRLEQRNQQRYERSVQREQRQTPQARAQASAEPERAERAVRVERRQSRREDSGNPVIEGRDERRESRIERRAAIANGEVQAPQAAPAQVQDQTQVRRWRTRGDDVTRNRTDRRDDRAGNVDRSGSRTAQNRDGRNWDRDGSRGDRNWNRDWRRDSRYDWQRYRYSNRNLFRPGRYYSPYRNYGYNRFTIGLTLGSGYYSNRYWINDPYQYRLPPAYPGTRWIRYYDDVLLVDLYTGQVIDVIHSFFW